MREWILRVVIKKEILDFSRRQDLARSWLSLVAAQEEVARAKVRLEELKSEISALDRLNVFTDTKEEAEEKDCKQRVQVRQKDVVRHAKDVASAMKELCTLEPDFLVALELEAFLRRTLQVESAAEAKKIAEDVEQWVERLTAGQRVWAEDDTPARLDGPFQNLGLSALTLGVALFHSTESVERRWGESIRVIPSKPLLKRLVQKCRVALASDRPGVPLPADLLQALRGEPEGPGKTSVSPLSALTEQQMEPGFEALETICRELAGLRLTLKLNRKKISALDRLNVFTDSESEARQKRLKAQTQALRARLQSELEAFHERHLRMRAELWPTLVLDLGHDLHTLVSSIGVSDPTGFFTKTAEILNREPAALAAHRFLQAIEQRFPGVPSLDFLQSQLFRWVDTAPLETAPTVNFPMPPLLEDSEIAALFHQALVSKGYSSSRQAIHDAEDRLANLQSEISNQSVGQKALGALSLFMSRVSDNSWRERQATQEYLAQARSEAEDTILSALWDAYAPCALHHLLRELTTQVASVRAVVESREREDSEGNTSTEYYSVAVGKYEAMATSLRIRRFLEKSSSDFPFPQQWLESYSESSTSQAIASQPLIF